MQSFLSVARDCILLRALYPAAMLDFLNKKTSCDVQNASGFLDNSTIHCLRNCTVNNFSLEYCWL